METVENNLWFGIGKRKYSVVKVSYSKLKAFHFDLLFKSVVFQQSSWVWMIDTECKYIAFKTKVYCVFIWSVPFITAMFNLKMSCLESGVIFLSLQVRIGFQVAVVRHSVTPSSAPVTWPYESVTQTCASPVGQLNTGTVKTSPARTAASREEPKRCVLFWHIGMKISVIILKYKHS